MNRTATLVLAFSLGICSSWAQTTAPSPDQSQIGYKAAADADQKKTLLLKDFHPVSMLHVPMHPVPKAKYYVIDVHNHINDAAGIDEHMDPKRVIEIMDATNVKTVIILTGMWGDKLQHVIDEMVKPYPGRFIVFTQIDWSRIDEPDFSQAMVRQLDDAVSRGARGLKVLERPGPGRARQERASWYAVDDPRMDPVWQECGRLGIPVSIHSGDPEAFFRPTDGDERTLRRVDRAPRLEFLRRCGISQARGVAGGAQSRLCPASRDAFRFVAHGLAGESRRGWRACSTSIPT
jgi:hypothetical protein